MFQKTALLICCMMAAAPLPAADWPQWRGPDRNGVSPEAGLLKQWPQQGPALVWRTGDLGDGYSTPSVAGGRVYLMVNKGLEDEQVCALSAADGKPLWCTRIGKVGNPKQNPSYPAARSTVTVEGDALYVLGSDGDIARLDTAGKVIWNKSARADFGGKPGQWAYSESPLVDGDRLIVSPGGAQAAVVALNKSTGEPIWKYAPPADEAAGYASVIRVSIGSPQYVAFLANGLVGLDAASGKPLWRYQATAKASPAVMLTPIESNGMVYSGGGRVGGGAVKISAGPGGFDAVQAYFSNKLPSTSGGAVLVKDHLYGSAQTLLCADFATGQIKWTDRSIAPASVSAADGMLYLHGENGEVALVEAAPDQYRERGRFIPVNPPDRGKAKAWAHPVIADGRLYIRQAGVVWCYQVK